MIWVFEVVVSLWFGYELVSYLARNHFDILQRFFAGIPVGIFTYSWITFAITAHSQLDFSKFFIPFVSLFFSSIGLHYLNIKNKLSSTIKLEFIHFWTLIIGGCFYVYLMYVSMLNKEVEVRGAGYGDTPFHMNIISSFACGCNNKRNGFYDVLSAFFAGERLAYPFITNFFTGVLMATGRATMRAAMFFPSALIILSFFVGQYSLSYKFTKDHFSCLIAAILFANLGGLGWIKYVSQPRRGYADWIHNWGNNQYEYWFHPLFHIIVPQRASLWSFPLCYWAILTLIQAVEAKDWRLFTLAGIFTGLSPLIQVHSFVSLAQWSIAYCIVTFPFFKYIKTPKKYLKWIKLWAIFGVVANVIAGPQFLIYFNRLSSSKNQFLQINPIWQSHGKAHYGNILGPIILWWRGLGVFWAIACFAGFSAMSLKQIQMYFPSIVVFIITNLIRYQPWELDNTKLFYAAWIPLALPVVGQFIARLARKKETVVIALFFTFASCFSAFLHSRDCLKSNPRIFQLTDVQVGLWIAENTPTKAVFLTSDWHVHPAATIAGRQLLLGYGGWVSSHGLDYWGKLDLTKKMLSNPRQLTNYYKYNVSYVISRNHEHREFEGNRDPNKFQIIFKKYGYMIYKFVA
ncbi:hypothetical protein TRFO_40655 [Tritrichomonas foetus]|uniref:Glycosyltransferase RgtA/B/C/D-like domain-containing protein n=1 Tax=Tritrichomonas foetus TaxID=1144522 RepID=A0A1J4J6H0_9EUKA|nr:hypothetical protein TRFO_40655 [Tritrichomonas foetus]|eukprot:OHS93029.1 hypothetical protein TRFO_40655 [Tritrichomonas foetus]